MPALKRVGHKGADLIAPGNTFASFDAALEHGVHMIEFDVLPERDSDRLLLAHDYEDATRPEVHTLEAGLDHLLQTHFEDIELDVDLKLPGYELRVVEALRERGLIERTLISSQYRESLAAIRAAEPKVRLGWSVPKLRRDPLQSWWTIGPALVILQIVRRRLPGQAAAAIRNGEVDALMSHWRLVTPRLVRAVNDAGGELYAWTVDDPRIIRRLESWGVHAVITNDPRLFDHQP